jgi:hypothetical protein
MSMAKGGLGPRGGGAGARVAVGVTVDVAVWVLMGVAVVDIADTLVDVRLDMPEGRMEVKSRRVKPRITRLNRPKRTIR